MQKPTPNPSEEGNFLKVGTLLNSVVMTNINYRTVSLSKTEVQIPSSEGQVKTIR